MIGSLLGRRAYPEPYRSLARGGALPVHRHRYGGERDQVAELRTPPSPSETSGGAPVVVLLHGGFWQPIFRLDLMNALAVDLAGRGFASWNVEYRRASSPGGAWPGTLRDVRAGIDALADVAASGSAQLDLGRVALVGHSAGGQLALWAAARHSAELEPPRVSAGAVVALAGVSDLVAASRLGLGNAAADSLLGGSPEERSDRYRQASPSALLPIGVAQLLVHGDRDEAVPQAMSVGYAESARAVGDDVELMLLEGVAHAALIDPAEPHWEAVVAWLRAQLAARAV